MEQYAKVLTPEKIKDYRFVLSHTINQVINQKSTHGNLSREYLDWHRKYTPEYLKFLRAINS